MSIATLKKKSRYNPRIDPISGQGHDGFSLNGGYRNIGSVGQFRLISNTTRTPFKGSIPMGHGGNNGNYYNHVLNSGSCCTNEPAIIKKSSLSTSGMIDTKYKWTKGTYPNYWVKEDDNSYNITRDQATYISNLSQETNKCNNSNGLSSYISQGEYISYGGIAKNNCLPTPANKAPFPMTLNHSSGCQTNYLTWQDALAAGALPSGWTPGQRSTEPTPNSQPEPILTQPTPLVLSPITQVPSGLTQVQFTSSGSWTAPAGITSIYILIVAGGGGGGSSYDTGSSGGGGAGQAKEGSLNVIPGNVYDIIVGSGGQGGAGDTTTNERWGTAGGNSSFDIINTLGGGGGQSSRSTVGGVATPGTNANDLLNIASTGGSGAGNSNGGDSGGKGGNGSSTGAVTSILTGATYGTGGLGGAWGVVKAGTNGTPNTGNGGTGSTSRSSNKQVGGNGGSGFIVLMY